MSWPAAYREDVPCPDDGCKYRPEVNEAPAGIYKDDDIICVNCGWSVAQLNARAKEAK